MLKNIDAQGNVTWDCGWRTREGAPACGQENTYHLSHDAIRWLNPNEVAMPKCSKCGADMTIRIPSEEEMTPPIITRDEQTGQILQVVPAPGYEHFDTHWTKEVHIVHTPIPHPTLQHLAPDKIKAMQEQIKAQAPDAPVDWMMTTIPHEDIQAVYPRPWVAHHQELARQLHAIGNVYTAPEEEPAPEPTMTMSQVKALIQDILRQHGIDDDDTGKQAAITPG